jgi:hypothetical protein
MLSLIFFLSEQNQLSELHYIVLFEINYIYFCSYHIKAIRKV